VAEETTNIPVKPRMAACFMTLLPLLIVIIVLLREHAAGPFSRHCEGINQADD
jgi:hypothetical protein